MRWYENLYVSEKASCEKLKSFGAMKKTFSFNAYMITLPANDNNLLEILSARELSCPYYEETLVIGIAVGKRDAIELVRDIIWDVYSHTGGFKIRDYLEKRAHDER